MRSRAASWARHLSRWSASRVASPTGASTMSNTMKVSRNFSRRHSRPPQVFRHRSAHAKDKRRDLIDIANRSTPELFDRQEHDLLNEVARGVLVAKMAQPVQPHAWGKTPIQFALGRLGRPGPARCHRACEIAVTGIDDRLHSTLTVLPAREVVESEDCGLEAGLSERKWH